MNIYGIILQYQDNKLFKILLSLKNNDIKFFYAYSFNLTRKYLPSFAILPVYPFGLGHKTRMELEITMVQLIILITKLMSPHNALIVLKCFIDWKGYIFIVYVVFMFMFVTINITMYQILQGIICVVTSR